MIMVRTMGRIILIVLVIAVGVSGCGMTRASHRPPVPIAVVNPIPPEKLAPKKGSIWQTTDRNTLFLDNKARNIGDIVTVRILENSAAEKEAKTDLTRTNASSFGLTGALNLTNALNAGGGRVPLNTAGFNNNHDFQGDASTDRKSKLEARISCIVTEVLPNGNLRIEGRQDITVNHENQFIILSGIIRPEDITPQNIVSSSQVADARIEYGGEGDMDEQQRPSWINRMFSSVNIF